ncbi:hypothetical protein P7K49_002138 [Saguinus oedipus]|uniref:Basic proline-rich protein-like n=1 Tax=Saguinus oedipus TaxID=9490 RepID=A0ABQ9WGI0_SAGOE|nr:hypothetical protein P7K49_002138 [Saguinus oedipus]
MDTTFTKGAVEGSLWVGASGLCWLLDGHPGPGRSGALGPGLADLALPAMAFSDYQHFALLYLETRKGACVSRGCNPTEGGRPRGGGRDTPPWGLESPAVPAPERSARRRRNRRPLPPGLRPPPLRPSSPFPLAHPPSPPSARARSCFPKAPRRCNGCRSRVRVPAPLLEGPGPGVAPRVS